MDDAEAAALSVELALALSVALAELPPSVPLADALAAGRGTCCSPLTVTLPSGDLPVKPAGSGVDAGGAAAPFAPPSLDEPFVDELESAVCVAAPAMMDEASSGEIVDVVVLEAPPFVPEVRTSWPSISGWLSTKMNAGPATCLVVSRSMTLLMSGFESLVTQTATGPLMPGGTLHWSRGRLMAKGAPPTIMLQKRP